MTTPPPPAGPPTPPGGRLTGSNGLQRSIDALTRAMAQSTGSWTRVLGQLAGGGSHTPGGSGFGGHPTFGMSPGAQAQWQYRIQQMQRMHASGMSDAQNAHVTARAAAQRAFQMSQAQWRNQQLTIGAHLASGNLSPDQHAAALRRAALSNQQFANQNSLYNQRIGSADNAFTAARTRLNDQRGRLDNSYQTAQQRQADADARAAQRLGLRQQRAQVKTMGAIASSAGNTLGGMASRFSSGIRDFNAGVDQYGRTVSLYGGTDGNQRGGGYGNRAVSATRQGMDKGLGNVAASDSDMFTGMAALYRQNNFANLSGMQRSAAATALVSPEMGVSGAAQLQAQMGTARNYYASQAFGMGPTIAPGGAKNTSQQTFASLFGQVSPKDLGKLSPEQMKAMLAQGGSLQTTLENYANASGMGSEGVQNAADYLTLSNKIRAKKPNMSQTDVDALLSDSAQSGKAGDKARRTLTEAAPGVGESYIDTQRRAEGAKREGKLDSSASYITAAISSANTLIDIRELIKPIMAPLRKLMGMIGGGKEGGGAVGVFSSVVGATLPAAVGAYKAVSGMFGGDDGPAKSSQGGSISQPTASKPGAGATANGAINFAMQQLGEPYELGAEGPDRWDCSSLTQAAYRSIGINLPRTTYQQIDVGQDVDPKDAQPGDLLFYPNVEHVVMAIGGGKVIQAPHTGDVVKISDLDLSKYGRAKRIVGSVGALSNTLSGKSPSKTSAKSGQGSMTRGGGGAYGSKEEVDAVASALSGGGGYSPAGATTSSTGSDSTSGDTGSASAGAYDWTAIKGKKGTIPAPPASIKSAILKGMSADGITGADWARGLTVIAYRESGYDPGSQNNSDSNARSGTPSQGLMQVIKPTFEEHRAKSLPDDPFDPAASVAAAADYIKGRYHGISGVQQANPDMEPKGYRAGAFDVPQNGDVRLHGGEMVLENNTAHTVRQALLKDSLRRVDPAATPGPGGSGQVALNFNQGSVVISMPSGSTESGSRQAARQFVDYVTSDDRIKKLMGGY